MDAKEFFYAFGKALYHIDAVYDDFSKAAGVVSPTLLWVLYALGDGRQHTQREICEDWALPKSTVNTVVTDLRKSGCVELKPIKGKRREMNVILTEKGKAYAETLLRDIYKKEADVFKQLDRDDLAIVKSLEKITTLLKTQQEEQS